MSPSRRRNQTLTDAPANGTFSKTERGVIQRCPCCQRLELRFGNIVFEIEPDHLPALSATLARMGGHRMGGRGGRPHLLRPCAEAPVAFAFSEEERKELERLVAGALFHGAGKGSGSPSAWA
jgi:hypothetical protein